jgi:excinuclease ABC subunit A
MVDHLLELKAGTRFVILAPIIEGRKGEHREALDQLRKKGLVRVRVDGTICDFDKIPALDKKKKHTVEAVVDRLVAGKSIKTRLADSLETALRLAGGTARVSIIGDQEHVFSETAACPDCGLSFDELSPRFFSFNSPYGACETCGGLGNKMEIDPTLVVPNPALSIFEGAIHPWGEDPANWYRFLLRGVATHFNFNFRTRFCDLPKEAQSVILTGSGRKEFTYRYEHRDGRGKGEFTGKFEGVIPNLERRYRQTESNNVRQWIEQYMRIIPCPACEGARLKPEALAVRVHGKSISEIVGWSIKRTARFFSDIKLNARERQIARQIMKELGQRLSFLVDVGLDYLTLDRSAQTLSGGEAQRIRLATQIGSRLVGVLYILDEPSIGLHQRDNRRLLNTLISLRDLGNSILVVEHDRETIEAADFVVDLGPGAGKAGGEIVAIGTPAKIRRTAASLTGQYLAHKKSIPSPTERRKGNGNRLRLSKAAGNNLKKITVDFPLGVLTCVTGVSGSGKSTLVNETLYRILASKFYNAKTPPLPFEKIAGIEQIDKVIDIDQSPIGRTPRSNPATYTGVFTFIRDLFAQIPEAKMRGYLPGRFSFNVKGGRCEACQGDGIIKIEMHFLPDVYVPCEVCKGKRYNRETLEIQFKGKTIADVLDMTVAEALEFFAHFPRIKNKLNTLANVGLGYIHLGQQATTLSGGEAQRVKLSTELSKAATGRTFYILDEPTTGLHFEDIKMLLRVLNELVDRGNTVVVIEHNLDVIKTADWVIDLGPEGGDDGGMVIAVGTPEEVAKIGPSYTGQFLKAELNSGRPKTRRTRSKAAAAG